MSDNVKQWTWDDDGTELISNATTRDALGFLQRSTVLAIDCPEFIDDADKLLIAAAPDLLAACKLALGAFERNDAIDWNELAAAIAKAEGR